jgi:ABC-type multidrug transport system permease subunit
VSEIPCLIICATLYFCCWYFTAGFPVEARISGHIYLQMICTLPLATSPRSKSLTVRSVYEFLYTSMGQAIAAYAPNEYFAAISNPLLIGCGLISFCGVVVPYTAMQPFWKYWIYWLDPFYYLVGGLLGPVVWDVQVKCKPQEFTSFDPPAGQNCAEYMADFLASNAGYLDNGDAVAGCRYCPYQTGADYAKTFNINEGYYPWRDVSSCSCQGLVHNP